MERIIDLDEAAAALARLSEGRRGVGLDVGPLTWRDYEASWPQALETDRTAVRDPDSVGIHVHGPDDAELMIVLFRGGWADVDFLDRSGDFGPLPAFDIVSVEDFVRRATQWFDRAFVVPIEGGRS
ncbi:hypothetical protein [Streptomyces sp. NPDC097619]|uniref:hypothetical protein n=1 Tax=Streptomyces sp. NPDC097619 TaxID=3157228 RepID=UPI003323C370